VIRGKKKDHTIIVFIKIKMIFTLKIMLSYFLTKLKGAKLKGARPCFLSLASKKQGLAPYAKL